MTPYLTTPPVRAVLYWQAGATLVGALVAGIWLGIDGAISALLGGLVILLSGIAYAVVISFSNSPSVETTLRTMIVAEAAKIGTIILMMWVVITAYKDLDGAAFFAAFVVTVLLNRVAFRVRSS